MAGAKPKPEAEKAKPGAEAAKKPEAPPAAVKEAPGPLRGWRDRWQIPLVLAGAVLLAGGFLMMPRAPMTGPDFAGALQSVERMIEAGEYGRAIEELNGPLGRLVNDARATDADRARFYALRGDALYLAQRARGLDVEANHTAIAEQYATAKRLDERAIEGRRLAFLADTECALGRPEQAERTLAKAPVELGDVRRRVQKRLIAALMASPKPDYDAITARLEAFVAEPGITAADRFWVLARRNEVRLALHSPQKLIDELLVVLQRDEGRTPSETGELFLLLGRAYLDLGRIEEAGANLARAEQLIPESETSHGVAEVLLARVAQIRGELEVARDRFAAVVARYQATDAMLPALLGLGEVEFDLGHEREAFEAYEQAAEKAAAPGARSGVSRDEVESSLTQRARKSFEEKKYENALRLAEIAAGMRSGNDVPAEAALRLAEAHLALAQEGMASIGADEEDGGAAALRAADAVTARQIRAHFILASEQYRRHSRAVAVSDPALSADSLWKAADCADRGGDQQTAIGLFTGYAGDRTNDPRRLEARFRAARALQSRGEHKAAAAIFDDIIKTGRDSAEAIASHVPLAQAILAGSGDAEVDKAEGVLLSLINSGRVDPTAKAFTAALVELGTMYRRVGRYPEAIRRLTEVLERSPDVPLGRRLRFDLADSYRLSASLIERQLQDAMPAAEREELVALRTERLEKALELYDRVRAETEAVPEAERRPIDAVIVRNSIFYRADCAFDLGDYDSAIRFYDSAAQRYARDPASLVAMVQIVNCYAALGKWAEARTAHERARARLAELPEDAWKRADVPMDRRHWERWLEASVRLDPIGQTAESAGGPGGESPG